MTLAGVKGRRKIASCEREATPRPLLGAVPGRQRNLSGAAPWARKTRGTEVCKTSHCDPEQKQQAAVLGKLNKLASGHLPGHW